MASTVFPVSSRAIPSFVSGRTAVMNVPKLDRNDLKNVQKVYKAEDFDFRLRPNSAAVDRGIVLPNVNEEFTGRAPDLGALETGKPVPHFGPRS